MTDGTVLAPVLRGRGRGRGRRQGRGRGAPRGHGGRGASSFISTKSLPRHIEPDRHVGLLAADVDPFYTELENRKLGAVGLRIRCNTLIQSEALLKAALATSLSAMEDDRDNLQRESEKLKSQIAAAVAERVELELLIGKLAQTQSDIDAAVAERDRCDGDPDVLGLLIGLEIRPSTGCVYIGCRRVDRDGPRIFLRNRIEEKRKIPQR